VFHSHGTVGGAPRGSAGSHTGFARGACIDWITWRYIQGERHVKRSTSRIVTTHVESLIRPDKLQQFLRLKQAKKPYDQAAHEQVLKDSVADIWKVQAQ